MEIKPFRTYRCRVTPRLTYQGRELKPAVIVLAGEEHEFEPLWQSDDDDPYPGEWVFRPTDRKTEDRFFGYGVAWIAQGDLTFL